MKKVAAITVLLFCAVLACGCEEKFEIKAVFPATGGLSGGEPVEIKGSGFSPKQGFTVFFGNQKAENVMVSDTTTLRVTSPGVSNAGPIDLRIVTDSGKEFLLKQAYRYVEKIDMNIKDLGERKSLREKKE